MRDEALKAITKQMEVIMRTSKNKTAMVSKNIPNSCMSVGFLDDINTEIQAHGPVKNLRKGLKGTCSLYAVPGLEISAYPP